MSGGAVSGLLSSHQVNMLSSKLASIVSASKCTMTVGAEAANAITVAVQLNDHNGNAISAKKAVRWYLSSDAAGDVALATAPNGGVAAGTDGMVTTDGDLSGLMRSESDGDIDFVITDSGTPTMYLCLVDDFGDVLVSDAITFA